LPVWLRTFDSLPVPLRLIRFGYTFIRYVLDSFVWFGLPFYSGYTFTLAVTRSFTYVYYFSLHVYVRYVCLRFLYDVVGCTFALRLRLVGSFTLYVCLRSGWTRVCVYCVLTTTFTFDAFYRVCCTAFVYIVCLDVYVLLCVVTFGCCAFTRCCCPTPRRSVVTFPHVALTSFAFGCYFAVTLRYLRCPSFTFGCWLYTRFGCVIVGLLLLTFGLLPRSVVARVAFVHVCCLRYVYLSRLRCVPVCVYSLFDVTLRVSRYVYVAVRLRFTVTPLRFPHVTFTIRWLRFTRLRLFTFYVRFAVVRLVWLVYTTRVRCFPLGRLIR